MAHPQIAAFARLAKGGDAPQRVIYGQATKLSRTMHDIRYSRKRDEIFVSNPFAQAVLTFKGSASGQAAPIRVIQGPKTQLSSPDTLTIDDVNQEIIVPDRDKVLVFPMTANGNVAPIRVLRGPRNGWRSGGGVAVDPIHNVLVTDGTLLGKYKSFRQIPYRQSRNSILIFNRTANGDVKPIRVISGPHTGIKAIRQMQIYPEKGWIIIAQIANGGVPKPRGAFVGVWSIYDNGDVPPRWKIDAKPGNVLEKPRGVALIPKYKELLVSDMRMNAVLTFYFPEIY